MFNAYPDPGERQQRQLLQFRDGASADGARYTVSDSATDQSGRDELHPGRVSRRDRPTWRQPWRRAAGRSKSRHGDQDPVQLRQAAGASAAAGPTRPPPPAHTPRRLQRRPGRTREARPGPDRASARLAAKRRRCPVHRLGANSDAFDHFRKFSLWPVKATILTGPRRSGRTLLARSFVERVGGRLFDEADRRDEEELFHAWNQAQDSGRPLVMVADRRLQLGRRVCPTSRRVLRSLP